MFIIKFLAVYFAISVSYSMDVGVPLSIWGNHPSTSYIMAFTGPVKEQDFYNKYVFPVTHDEHPILIFLEKELEVQDLIGPTSAEEPFQNVNKLMKEAKYNNFLPQVLNPVKAFLRGSNILPNLTPENFDNLSSTFQYEKIHVMKLNYSSHDRFNTLRDHDILVSEACRKFAAKNGAYVCVLTGLSGVAGLEDTHARFARQASSPDEATNTNTLNVYYNPDVGMIYTKSPPNITNLSTQITYRLTPVAVTVQEKSLSVRFGDLNGSKDLHLLKFNFNTIEGTETWKLQDIEYTDVANSKRIMLSSETPISTSVGYSWHTPSKVIFKGDNVTVAFESLQMQYFKGGNHPKRFDVADDTVYFFTIPILGGLLVTSLLVTIVLIGLSMIFDIKTMDQFDDPKGKTVTINASE